MSVQEPPVWTPAPQGASPEEYSALSRMFWFGAVSLIGMVAGWAVGIYAVGVVNMSAIAVPGANPSPAQVSAFLGPMFNAMSLLVPLSLTIELVGLVILTMGFRRLKQVDSARFSVPSTLMIIALVGVLMVGAGIIPLFNGLPSILAQVPSTPGTVPSTGLASAIGAVVVYVLVIGTGGLLALVGVIGGVVLGLWRVGSRYDEPLFKIGAIFVIIPLLDVVSPILILVGARHARGKLSRTGAPI